MKNSYRYCHVGDWKSPRLSGACLVIATYDMRSDAYVIDVLKSGTSRANALTEETLAMAKEACGLGFFQRSLDLR